LPLWGKASSARARSVGAGASRQRCAMCSRRNMASEERSAHFGRERQSRNTSPPDFRSAGQCSGLWFNDQVRTWSLAAPRGRHPAGHPASIWLVSQRHAARRPERTLRASARGRKWVILKDCIREALQLALEFLSVPRRRTPRWRRPSSTPFWPPLGSPATSSRPGHPQPRTRWCQHAGDREYRGVEQNVGVRDVSGEENAIELVHALDIALFHG
jgi:hypothetical protein